MKNFINNQIVYRIVCEYYRLMKKIYQSDITIVDFYEQKLRHYKYGKSD